MSARRTAGKRRYVRTTTTIKMCGFVAAAAVATDDSTVATDNATACIDSMGAGSERISN